MITNLNSSPDLDNRTFKNSFPLNCILTGDRNLELELSLLLLFQKVFSLLRQYEMKKDDFKIDNSAVRKEEAV